MKYYVDFGTGTGNYESNLEISDLIDEVTTKLSYTQECVQILDESRHTLIAYLPWWGTTAEEDVEITVDFRDFGYYGAWEIL